MPVSHVLLLNALSMQVLPDPHRQVQQTVTPPCSAVKSPDFTSQGVAGWSCPFLVQIRYPV